MCHSSDQLRGLFEVFVVSTPNYVLQIVQNSSMELDPVFQRALQLLVSRKPDSGEKLKEMLFESLGREYVAPTESKTVSCIDYRLQCLHHSNLLVDMVIDLVCKVIQHAPCFPQSNFV